MIASSSWPSAHTPTFLSRLSPHWAKVLLLAMLAIFIVAAPFVFSQAHPRNAGATCHCPMRQAHTPAPAIAPASAGTRGAKTGLEGRD